MADAKLTALTAASALAAADLFYVSQSAASRNATGTQLLALVGTTYVPLAGGTMTGALTLPAGAVGTPSLMFTGAGATTGFYSTGANALAVGINGTNVVGINSSGMTVGNAMALTTGGRLQGYMVGVLGAYSSDFRVGSTAGYDIVFGVSTGSTELARITSTGDIRAYKLWTDANNYERLTLSGVAGTSVNITAETLGTGADNLNIVLTPAGTGVVSIPALVSATSFTCGNDVTMNFSSAGIRTRSTGEYAWTAGNATAAADTALHRDSAGVAAVDNGTAGTYRDLKLRNLLNVEYHQMTEMTAPSAPATNSVRIYAEDNGSGKTRLMALFATGAAQQIAIEP